MGISNHKRSLFVGVSIILVGLIAPGCGVSPASETLSDTSDKNVELTEPEKPIHDEKEAVLLDEYDDNETAPVNEHEASEKDIIEVTLNVVEGRNWEFDPSLIEVPVGHPVKLTLVNNGRAEHDVEIAEMMAEHIEVMGEVGQNMDMDDDHMHNDMIAAHAMPGHTASVTFTPTETGEYEFTCTLPGHKEAGMVGRVIVTD